MIHTGIIRRVDDLGRISIPREIRRELQIQEGTPMELIIGENGVTFVKYNPTDTVQSTLNVLKEVIREETDLKGSDELLKKVAEMEKLLNQQEGPV